jgi:GGDEF domain-containing protein
MGSAGLPDVSLPLVERALLDMRNRRSTWQFVSIITLTSVVTSVVCEVAELEQVAHVDVLAGESNRRHFFARGREIIADRTADEFAIVLYANKSSSVRVTDRSETRGRVTEAS